MKKIKIDLSTKNLIKILPLGQQFKQDLIERFESLNEDQKYTIDSILWDTYYALYQLKLEENIQLAMHETGEGSEKLDAEFYKRMREKTDEQMQQEQIEGMEKVELTQTRKKLEDIIKIPKTDNN